MDIIKNEEVVRFLKPESETALNLTHYNTGLKMGLLFFMDEAKIKGVDDLFESMNSEEQERLKIENENIKNALELYYKNIRTIASFLNKSLLFGTIVPEKYLEGIHLSSYHSKDAAFKFVINNEFSEFIMSSDNSINIVNSKNEVIVSFCAGGNFRTSLLTNSSLENNSFFKIGKYHSSGIYIPFENTLKKNHLTKKASKLSRLLFSLNNFFRKTIWNDLDYQKYTICIRHINDLKSDYTDHDNVFLKKGLIFDFIYEKYHETLKKNNINNKPELKMFFKNMRFIRKIFKKNGFDTKLFSYNGSIKICFFKDAKFTYFFSHIGNDYENILENNISRWKYTDKYLEETEFTVRDVINGHFKEYYKLLNY